MNLRKRHRKRIYKCWFIYECQSNECRMRTGLRERKQSESTSRNLSTVLIVVWATLGLTATERESHRRRVSHTLHNNQSAVKPPTTLLIFYSPPSASAHFTSSHCSFVFRWSLYKLTVCRCRLYVFYITSHSYQHHLMFDLRDHKLV